MTEPQLLILMSMRILYKISRSLSSKISNGNLVGVESSKYLIYSLSDPRTGEIRYVGKSCCGLARPFRHLKSVGRTHKDKWVRSLQSEGFQPLIEVIEDFPTPDVVDEAERFWISQLRSLGFRLTNHTDGGEGSLGRITSQATRDKIGLANSGHTHWLGRKHTPESKAKIALAAANRSPEWRKQRSIISGSVSKQSRLRNSKSQGGKQIVDQAGRTYDTICGAARELGISASNIRLVLQGKYKQIRGHVFSYLEVPNAS